VAATEYKIVGKNLAEQFSKTESSATKCKIKKLCSRDPSGSRS